jgi:hypothetical protein
MDLERGDARRYEEIGEKIGTNGTARKKEKKEKTPIPTQSR